MTYANDMIAMKKRLITQQNDAQLDRAVELAVKKFGEDFWTLLYGVDAYMERRRRRTKAGRELFRRTLHDLMTEGDGQR
jgi:hypothetical protein